MFHSWSFIVLIYINDFSKVFSTNAKLFADNTSLFFVVNNIQILQIILMKAWKEWISGLIDRKLKFNPDTAKQAQEVILSHKTEKRSHPALLLNSTSVNQLRHLPNYTRKLYLTLSQIWRPSKNGFWKSKQNFRTSS